jgi:hypothetical protein
MTPDAVLALLAARLVDLRARKVLKQAGCTLSKNTVYRMEHGKDCRLTSLVILADDYDCDVVIELRPRSQDIGK